MSPTRPVGCALFITLRMVWFSVLCVFANQAAAEDCFRLPTTLHLRNATVVFSPELVAVEKDAMTIRSGHGEQRIALAEVVPQDRKLVDDVVSSIFQLVAAAQPSRAAERRIELRKITGRTPRPGGEQGSYTKVFVMPPLGPTGPSAAKETALNLHPFTTATPTAEGDFDFLIPSGIDFVVVAQAISEETHEPTTEWRTLSRDLSNDRIEFSDTTRTTVSGHYEGLEPYAKWSSTVVVESFTVAAAPSAPSVANSASLVLKKRTYDVVTVFYGTDRNYERHLIAKNAFGRDRGPLSFGSCEVSIPADHHIGELETKSRWSFFRDADDPTRYVVILGVHRMESDVFLQQIRSRIASSAAKKVLIFVHGYNVTFEDAARRTAQITADLDFKGVPIFFSWPSQGETAKYPTDETNIEWSEPDLRSFLKQTIAASGAEEVYLVAHSMGNRALTRALGNLAIEAPNLRASIKAIILAAPDIDADVFKRDIAPRFVPANVTDPAAPIVTLYVSKHDLALAASKKFHSYPRVGDCSDGIAFVPGVETVDASSVDTDIFSLGHSYFGYSRSVLSDIHALVVERLHAEKRFGLRTIDSPAGKYWAFKE